MGTWRCTSSTVAAERLDKRVSTLTKLSRSRVKALIQEGCVRVDGVIERKPSLKVSEEVQLEVELPELRPSSLEAQDLGLELLYEDEHLVVLVKPAGMVVHPSKGNV